MYKCYYKTPDKAQIIYEILRQQIDIAKVICVNYINCDAYNIEEHSFGDIWIFVQCDKYIFIYKGEDE